MAASVDKIRSHFPALERVHNGFPVAYFDGPGGTQVPRAVAAAMADYLYSHNANTHWEYPSSAETDQVISAGREAMADFLNASPAEIVLGANATTLAFHTSRALGRTFEPGDEIVVTELDHHANIGPWQALVRERGCVLQTVRMDPEAGILDWDDFESRVNKCTKLIAVGAASNALGTINDIPRAVELAHSNGAYAFVDAVHYAPHQLIDVRGWNCDFLTASAYKFYGPHVGVMYCRANLLETLPFAKVAPASDCGPERAETGTLNHEGIAGATAAVDYLESLAEGDSRRTALKESMAAIEQRGAALLKQMWDGLVEIDGVALYGPPPDQPRTSTIAFTVRGVAPATVAARLADNAVFVSDGDFYAQTVIERLGLAPEGVVRAGCACYTTTDEVERLVAGVRKIASSA